MKKVLTIILVASLIALQSLSACTIFAVGKGASVNGSTMISHTCDSTSDDFTIFITPSMPAGTERDVVLNGRAGADYSNFPEVKNYGPGALVLGSITLDEPSNQYIHAMYSFINDKGLAMGESTCSYNRNSEQGKKLTALWDIYEGIYDCYMLQDIALETCSTAREAVELMGSLVDQYGWNGLAECINICDGNEAWIFEVYGGNIWVAARVPDDSVFVAANRARVNIFIEDDPENYLYHEGIKEFAIENDLWSEEDGAFIPCKIFAPNPERTYSTRREWVALTLLDPTLDLDPEEKNPDENWPLFVKPAEKLSAATIHSLSSNYYQGTPYDVTKTYEAGPYGNPISPRHAERTINCFRCTYIQISEINTNYAEEARCLAWFGWGAPDSTYLTPIWASQTSLPDHFGRGNRFTYDRESGWWNASVVQQLATINYQSAIQDIYAARGDEMAAQYEEVAKIQKEASDLIEEGRKSEGIALLTDYSTSQAEEWFARWSDLSDMLTAKYMLGNVNMRSGTPTEWWAENAK